LTLNGSVCCALPTVCVRVPRRMRDRGTQEAVGRLNLPRG
jgi:hypothetical protein